MFTAGRARTSSQTIVSVRSCGHLPSGGLPAPADPSACSAGRPMADRHGSRRGFGTQCGQRVQRDFDAGQSARDRVRRWGNRAAEWGASRGRQPHPVSYGAGVISAQARRFRGHGSRRIGKRAPPSPPSPRSGRVIPDATHAIPEADRTSIATAAGLDRRNVACPRDRDPRAGRRVPDHHAAAASGRCAWPTRPESRSRGLFDPPLAHPLARPECGRSGWSGPCRCRARHSS